MRRGWTCTKIFAESLASYMFKLNEEDGEIFTGILEITKGSLRPGAKLLSMSNEPCPM